ncbi:MAG: phosphoenolpyruvate carboxykinase (GTP) [Candidatus Omnitrophica bacterium]|nr:phosphoenolpyruvate carboxykinase (GTP) [Candidatus Omnitrophota bacterium]MBU1048317.1 phosphoenolpyruvate carboxykinase (GTP) [Candidatus Omnitrophota bacterium]MBU1630284.1 phosphoenolpyruvate carboxykinase (GTP) [Candidatus Omnitrophota bacterium]MBU1767574.1 phosphoenolpyruvate carboxykinase (GTP) [Candidatus Omnitrophota bacterium]MBU1889701.1 phosphoenolpyruvate carboxykinase (GTP) [Candidatus Omnitrophota bacterium]
METKNHLETLKPKLDELNYQKLSAIANPKVHEFIAKAAELCKPEQIFICSDSLEDIDHVRKQAIQTGEEKSLVISGHTYHFDGMEDQGRDREVTKYLVSKNNTLSKTLNQIEREEGLTEITELMLNSMKNRTMIVRFLSLGPRNSVFSVPCLQCTDSWYVAHSEDLLYRSAYKMFEQDKTQSEIFCFLHSAGKMNEKMVSIESDKKRIYIDYNYNTVYSVNTQYAGNTVGLKKLALRLTIRKADREGWLAEHMLLMGVHGPKSRKTYFVGAFPSACGKTSTAMLPGETVVGDDIAYFRNIDGKMRAVNAEAGIFGIIQNINPIDDPVIHKVLTTPGEVIFSNILVNDSKPYWLGMDGEMPKEGINFSGRWHANKTDDKGNQIPPAHKNARYAVAIKALKNVDTELDNPIGVELAGIMYGGRDAKAYVPVQQSFDWNHGIIAYGASLETETTFATIGKEGVSEINAMSIQDFVSIPLGKYIRNNLEFGKKLKNSPMIFGVNYFLRNKEGKFLNGVRDKHVWVKWMELRAHNEVDAIKGPTGWIPKYNDLNILFKQVLDKNYSKEDYTEQFTIRINENLAKIERVGKFYHENVSDTPPILLEVLNQQKERLIKAKERFGDYISPELFGEKK